MRENKSIARDALDKHYCDLGESRKVEGIIKKHAKNLDRMAPFIGGRCNSNPRGYHSYLFEYMRRKNIMETEGIDLRTPVELKSILDGIKWEKE